MAGFAILSWPLFALLFFAMLGPGRGLIWSTVVGYLFLPVSYGFDLPVVFYEKDTALAIGSLLGVLLFRDRTEQRPPPVAGFKGVMLALLAVYLLSSFGTLLTNSETLTNGPITRPSVSMPDVIGMVTNGLIILVPFLLAWRYLGDPKLHRELLLAIMFMGLAYTLPILIELRLSPQLNVWIYGYFPHSFLQHIRGGGYRPLVFLQHALELGLFILYAVLAVFALARQEEGKRKVMLYLLGAWFVIILLFSRNTGAVILAVTLIPALLVLGRKPLVWMAVAAAVLFLTLPALRQGNLVTFESLTSAIATVSAERAGSLQFRMDNEVALLERALEKPLFGWGGWSRAEVFSEEGYDLSVTDGLWIIILGQRGWIGYLTYFGLMCLPLLYLLRRQMTFATAGLATIGAATLIYSIPNAFFGPVSWMVFGCLAGFAARQAVSDEAGVAAPEALETDRRTTRYSRFVPGTRPSERPARSVVGHKPR
jgi:hypothetical protein